MNTDIEKIITLENITKLYNINSHESRGVEDINICAARGEQLLILGPSGSGKTTIITLCAGLIQPSKGTVILFGKNVKDYSRSELQKLRADCIGFIFQTFLLIDSLTVTENIKLVQRFSKKRNQIPPEELLKKFGIYNLRNSFPGNLSQGEKQRAAVARAIANDPALILADEPTASLESNQGFVIIELLKKYAAEENKCVIVVSHDLRISKYADRILKIEDGKIK